MVIKNNMHTFKLIISCPDGVGIVAKISGFIAQFSGWIESADHYSDMQSGWFFMRYEIRAKSLPFSFAEFREKIAPIVAEFGGNWHLTDSLIPKKMVLLASKESHCLVDLLHRWHVKELDCQIVAVIANHQDMQDLVTWYGVDFHHIPINSSNKNDAFNKIHQLVKDYQADCLVLARYMQILPPKLCDEYKNRIINIHHSFLPSFVGAKPYHQAAIRGVKLIGATCHYVTEDLDAGPIIEQDVVRVSHKHSADDMVKLGKDVERRVLARGVQLHLADRIMVHGNKTVLFD